MIVNHWEIDLGHNTFINCQCPTLFYTCLFKATLFNMDLLYTVDSLTLNLWTMAL
jgi:hypothetical protein